MAAGYAEERAAAAAEEALRWVAEGRWREVHRTRDAHARFAAPPARDEA